MKRCNLPITIIAIEYTDASVRTDKTADHMPFINNFDYYIYKNIK